MEETLQLISKGVSNFTGNLSEEIRMLTSIADPQDSLNCEGCQ